MGRTDLLKWWPIITVAAASCVAYGALYTNVAELQRQKETAASDHDAIVRIEAEQRAMKESVGEIKESVKEIARAVQSADRATSNR